MIRLFFFIDALGGKMTAEMPLYTVWWSNFGVLPLTLFLTSKGH